MTYQAQTAYGVPIPRALTDKASALAWFEENAETFPGCRIVRMTKRGPRTVLKHEPEGAAA